MIGYYNVPQKKGLSKQDKLHISDDSELKDAIFSKALEKIKYLSFKNSILKQQSLCLLSPLLQTSITHLDLSQNFSFITDSALEIITTQPCFKQLLHINLADNQITDEGIIILSRSNTMMNLEELILYGNSEISGASLLFLAESPLLKHLKYLDLHATSVDDKGLQMFFSSENSSAIEELNLSMSWKSVTDKTIYNLAHSPHCKHLKKLILDDCHITDYGMDELSESQNSSNLVHLSLNNSSKQSQNNVISDKTLASIGLSKYMTSLKIVELKSTGISAKGIKTLAVALAAEQIETLRLSHCRKIDSEVFTYLEKILSYQNLKKLYLNECKIDLQDLKSFQEKHPELQLIF